MAIDPITILLFIFFVVLPLVNSLRRNQGGDAPPPGTPQSGRGRSAGPTAGQPGAPRPQAGPADRGGGPRPDAGSDDDFTRRLEEARRRVQEALGETPETPRSPEPRRVKDDRGLEDTIAGPSRPDRAPASPPRPVQRTTQRPPGTRPVAPAQASTSTPTSTSTGSYQPLKYEEKRYVKPQGPEGSRQYESLESLTPLGGETSLRTAPPMRVTRTGTKQAATLGQSLLRFDRDSIYSGFIWHQILSEPRYRQARRKRSTPRSH